MPLIDLSRIVLQRTVIGIACPSCGGDLEVIKPPKRGYWRRLIAFQFLKRLRYRCKTCGHRFKMSRQP